MASTDQVPRKMRVTNARDVAEGVRELTLSSVDGALPDWEPGAHVDLILNDHLTRQYSLCGDVNDRQNWVVSVLREPASRGGSVHVHDQVRVGDVIDVTGPRNNFTLEPAAGYVFIAGGIGITPLLPMIAEAERRGARWRLHYGGRSKATMAYRDRFVDGDERVAVRTEEEDGRLDLGAILASTSSTDLIYACGPGGMLDVLRERCSEDQRTRLHLERFVAETVDRSEDSPIQVTCQVSCQRFTVGSRESILDACRREGIDVYASCEEGTCGSCETVVVSGVPLHRDSVLSEAERAAGEVMMICVSRAVTPELVLDL